MLFSRCLPQVAIASLLLLTPSFTPNIAFVASAVLAQEATPQDRKAEADRLYQEDDRLMDEGRYQEAIEQLQQALEIYREVGDRQGEGNTFNSLGGAYGGLGECPQQLDAFQRSLVLQRQVGNRQMEGLVLNHVGAAHVCLGQYSQALEIYQQALLISGQVGAASDEALILLNIGSIYDITGQYPEALNAYQQALTLYRQNETGELSQRQSAILAFLIGSIYNRTGQYQQATETLQQSLSLYRQLGDKGMERHLLQEFGRLYDNLKQYSTARNYYQQALILAREGNVRRAEAGALSDIGFTLEMEEQTELAIIFYKQSVDITEFIRRDYRVLTQEQQESFTESIAYTYRRLANLLLQQDRVLEAQQVLDLLKVQELDDYLQNVRGSDRPTQPLDYLQPEQRILDLYNQAIAQGQELAQLRQIPQGDRTSAQQQRLAELVANQQNITQSFDDFLSRPDVTDAINQLSRTARRQNLDLEHLNALQDNLRNLNQNAVLLYPLILDDRLELVLVTPYSPPIRRTVNVNREELNRAIAQFRSRIVSRSSRSLTEAQQLYQWLIAPIENDLQQANAQTILYAPDGQLRYIPLAALHNGEQWLIEQYRINHITAASLTDFDTPRQQPLNVIAGAFTEGSYSFQVGTRQFSYSGLPFARIEVEAIASEIPGTTELVDRAFSPQAMIPRMDDYSVVHLGTHAEFVTGSPDDSFILFGNGDRVTLRDISSWSLPNVDLVVLSACETAVSGELGNGEEILGFGYQMQRTGARAAIASLWYVDDGGTQVLMNAFYKALEQPGMTKAEALRQAQIALITGDFESLGIEVTPQLARYLDRPYYWAPFILIGNGL